MLRVIREIKPTWVLGENVPGILRIAGKTVCEDLERAGYAVTVFNFEAAAVGAPHRRERVFFVGHSTSKYVGRDNRGEGEGIRLGMASGILDQGGWYKGEHIIDTSSHDVADTESDRRNCKAQQEMDGEKNCGKSGYRFDYGSKNVADTDNQGLSVTRLEPKFATVQSENGIKHSGWRAIESRLGGMVNGIPCWLDGYWRVEPNIPRVATGVKNRVDRLKCLGNAVVPQQVYPILKAIAEIETH
jgi:DNA (cytosine-5)-methyltransferase 1